MPLIDPFKITRPPREVFTRIFEAEGVPFTVAFRRPTAAELSRAEETKQRLVKDFITGHPEDGTPPADFYDGIRPSEGYLEMCAVAEHLQPPKEEMPEEAQWFEAVQFAVLIDRLGERGRDIARFITEMTIRGGNALPNSAGAPTANGSVERSTSTTLISRFPPAPTTSSGPSTSGSAPSAGEAETTPALT